MTLSRLLNRWVILGLVGIAFLLIPNVTPTYAQPVGFGVPPGLDLFETDMNNTFQELFIPPGFFGPGCESFDGIVDYQGVPIDTLSLGTTDTIVERLDTAFLPEIGSETTVQIEIVELSLRSVEPFQVNCEGYIQQWMLDVSLSGESSPQGQMTFVRTNENGGTFTSDLPVQPLLVFTRVDDPSQQVVLDTGIGIAGIPPFVLHINETPWVSGVDCPPGVLNGNFCPGAVPGVKVPFIAEGDGIRHQVWMAGLPDFGDALDPTYPTLLVNDGARHTIEPGFFLGFEVDSEPDGQPSVAADGDDINPISLDDEDGVFFTTPLTPGSSPTVDVIASDSGFLDAWIDFNGDGDWADVGEQIFTSEPLVTGLNVLPFVVPLSATPDITTVSRFRLSRTGGLSFHGPAPHGEVEDHLVEIEGGPQLINDQLAIAGIQTPAPGTTPPGGIYTIVVTFVYGGVVPINDILFVVTQAEYLDGGTPGPQLDNRDSGTPSGVGAELTVTPPGDVLNPGEQIDVTFDVLIPRVAPFAAAVNAFVTP